MSFAPSTSIAESKSIVQVYIYYNFIILISINDCFYLVLQPMLHTDYYILFEFKVLNSNYLYC